MLAREDAPASALLLPCLFVELMGRPMEIPVRPPVPEWKLQVMEYAPACALLLQCLSAELMGRPMGIPVRQPVLELRSCMMGRVLPASAHRKWIQSVELMETLIPIPAGLTALETQRLLARDPVLVKVSHLKLFENLIHN